LMTTRNIKPVVGYITPIMLTCLPKMKGYPHDCFTVTNNF
jgi:hypothetical protein